jgi:prepilin-type N-terminal cleavage/methylation domain-containing protein
VEIVKVIRDRLGLSAAPDGGFTLIEVVVAIVILGLLATLSLSLYLSSMHATNSQQRRDIGITIANESMESVVAWQVSGLLTGRFKNTVESQWAGAAGVSGIAKTYPKWDPAATGSSTPAVPLTRTVTRLGSIYKASTYIGSCMQPVAGGDCVRLSPTGNEPVAPAGYARLIRIIVVVSWTAGDACSPSGCSYETSTLIDPNSDLQWKLNV